MVKVYSTRAGPRLYSKRAGPHRYQYELSKRKYNARADAQAFVDLTEKAIMAVVRQSLQDVVEVAQLPVAKGGKMRVDTGFLRASGQASLTGMPSGPGRGEKDAITGQYDNGDKPLPPSMQTALANLKPGQPFYFGWTAEYAKYREAYDGFLEGAIMSWSEIVNKNVAEIKKRMKQ